MRCKPCDRNTPVGSGGQGRNRTIDTRIFIRRRARFGASKSKERNRFPRRRPSRSLQPSPYRTGTPKFRPNSDRTVRRTRRPELRCSSFGKPRRRKRFSASTDRRRLSGNTTRRARSASNRRTIQANTITPRSCHRSVKVPLRRQCVPDSIFAEHRDGMFTTAPFQEAGRHPADCASTAALYSDCLGWANTRRSSGSNSLIGSAGALGSKARLSYSATNSSVR